MSDKGKAVRQNREILENFAEMDDHLDHQDNCGQCYHQRCMAEVAREILAANPGDLPENAISEWCELTKQRWEAGKYYKLWQQAVAEGLEPQEVFKERGWEP